MARALGHVKIAELIRKSEKIQSKRRMTDKKQRPCKNNEFDFDFGFGLCLI